MFISFFFFLCSLSLTALPSSVHPLGTNITGQTKYRRNQLKYQLPRYFVAFTVESYVCNATSLSEPSPSISHYSPMMSTTFSLSHTFPRACYPFLLPSHILSLPHTLPHYIQTQLFVLLFWYFLSLIALTPFFPQSCAVRCSSNDLDREANQRRGTLPSSTWWVKCILSNRHLLLCLVCIWCQYGVFFDVCACV